MSTELKIPSVGESIQEVQIGKWLKDEGDAVKQDENIVELETEKASMQLPAPADGVLTTILKKTGETVAIGTTIAKIETGDGQQAEKKKQKTKQKTKQKKKQGKGQGRKAQDEEQETKATAEDEAAAAPKQGRDQEEPETGSVAASSDDQAEVPATPSARRALREYGLAADEVEPRGERLRVEDVRRHVGEQSAPEASEADPEASEADTEASEADPDASDAETAERDVEQRPEEETSNLERVVPMSFIRRRIAKRLVEAQQQGALVTTFNEIDMAAVIELRRDYRERFADEHGVDLGLMPFFVKAVVAGLGQFPELNAEVRGESIVYRDYYHIGIAVGGGEGLVVPVLRFAERMSFAEIEEAIADFARRAKSNELEPQELQNGTFTISNGGVYGSLLSTPIVNPPQSGVLGMHAIQQRPVVRDNEIVIRPQMYVALTYDHRVVDGREAVLFLQRVKAVIEEPARLLMEV